jgi:hypothetical protein
LIYDIDNLPKAFNLGRQGENLVTYIEIDCAAWLDEYEGATMGATIILPKQIEPVPLPIEMNDKIMTIPVTRSITSVAGKGSINIRLLGLDDEEKRSKVVGTNVDESHAAAIWWIPDTIYSGNADDIIIEWTSAVGGTNLPTSGTGQGYLIHTFTKPDGIRIQIAYGLGMLQNGSAGKNFIRVKEVGQSYGNWVQFDAKNADTVDGKHASDLANAIHAHGNITNDGKIGTDSDKFLVTGAGGSIGVKTKQEAASLIGVSNPNILHNWDFRNPINQRGLATASGGGYWLDRWTVNNTAGATYTYSSSWGLRVVTTADYLFMRQYIENPNAYAGKTVTVSFDIYSASVTNQFSVRLWYNGQTQFEAMRYINNGDTGIKSFTATIPNTELTDLSVVFYNYAGNDVRIKSIKLELGTVSTLHLDPPMDWAVEMPKCLRFFVNLKQKPILYGYRNTYTGAVFYLPLSVPMRINPTFSSYSEIKIAAGNSWIPGTVSNIEMTNSGNLKVFINTEQTIPEAPLIATISAGNNDITLSADL